MHDFESILPAPVFGELDETMVSADLALTLGGLAVPVAYQAYELGKERFIWFPDPSGNTGDDPSPFSDRIATAGGPLHYYLRLHRRRGGWRVEKVHFWPSGTAARTAAGMAWAGGAGYLVALVGGEPVLGPRTADITDIAKYLDVTRAVRNARRRGKNPS